MSISNLKGIWGKMQKVIPNFELRDEQIKMSEAVQNSFSEGQHLVVEAGTGIGKSLAYLLPAAELSNDATKVVVSTATIALQEQLLYKDLPLMENVLDREIRVEVIKGRKNYLCLEKFNQLYGQGSLDDSEAERALIQWVQKTATGDKIEIQIPYQVWEKVASGSDTCLGMKCSFFEECFVVKLRRRAEEADLLITNHHLFFSDLSLRVNSEGNLSVFPDYECVIFDEAHHIPQIATRALGRELSYAQVIKLFRELKQYIKEKPAGEVNYVDEAEMAAEKAYRRLIEWKQRDYLLRELDSFVLLEDFREKFTRLTRYVEGLVMEEKHDPERAKMVFSKLYQAKLDLDLVLDVEEQDYVSWVHMRFSTEGTQSYNNSSDARDVQLPAYDKGTGTGTFDVSLCSSPVEVNSLLAEFLFDEIKNSVLTSATLAVEGGFQYFLKQVGLDQLKNVKTLELDSPFQYEQQVQIFVPASFPEPRTEDFIRQLPEAIKYIIHTAGGKTLVLFTSYQMMDHVYDCLKEEISHQLLCQGLYPKNFLLSEFQKDTSSVLLATNSFREGVDIPGEALQVVVMDKLPFSVPDDPLFQAKKEKLESQGKNTFTAFSLPEAILRVKQGFGRLIRHRQDRGVFILLDSRVMSRPYGPRFLNSLPASPLIKKWPQLDEALKRLASH